MKKKDVGVAIVKWIENTTLDPDVIFNHFEIPKSKRPPLREMAKQIREELWSKKPDERI